MKLQTSVGRGFYSELRHVNNNKTKKKSPCALVQMPLKEQWAESKTAKSQSLQPACYVILEFSKYYVSGQLRMPRSGFVFFFFKAFFCLWKTCSGGQAIFSISAVYDSCWWSLKSFKLILGYIKTPTFTPPPANKTSPQTQVTFLIHLYRAETLEQNNLRTL